MHRLQSSDHDFRLLFESSPGLYLVLTPTPEFTIVAVSDAYLRATMTVRGEILGRQLFEVFPDNPEDAGASGVRNLRASLHRVIVNLAPDTMGVQKYDIRRPEAAGGGFEERYWSLVNSPVIGPDGTLKFIIHRVEDVTEFVRLRREEQQERKRSDALKSRAQDMEAEMILRAQQLLEANRALKNANAELALLRAQEQKDANRALHESEQRFRRLFESDVVGIAISDTDCILEANDYFLQTLGYSREELQAGGALWQTITPADNGNPEQGRLRQLQETGTHPAVETELLRKDGTRVHVLLGRVSLYQEPEMRLLSFIVDLSERRRLEDQFLKAQKLEGIGRLAGGVAHDFNNLLTVITGYAQMALSDLDPQHPIYDSLGEISAAAERATVLTRQLLAFSRRQVSQPRDIAMNDVVSGFEKMLRRLIGEDIELVLSLNPDAGGLHADPGQIEQVILNLAVNARDAMPTGGKLAIETSSLFVDEEFAAANLSLPPGEYVMLAVSDTGVGMSAEVKAHVFEPFFTTKEPGKGTGLGLSTVYGIIKHCGGSIWIYSEVGQGTTFKLLFPAEKAKHEESAPAPLSVDPSGDETILLAEDEAGVRRYVRQILERHGYTVLEAENGREALELARENSGGVHLLLTDVVMPKMGGAELAEEFFAAWPAVPVLCMSGYTDRLGKVPARAASYVQKPFTPAVLLGKIRELLGEA
jgi:PAS domain S-box-containing protein